MAGEVIAQKLESLRRCLKRIEAKCPADWEALADQADLQDIITLNLTRAVQLCVDMGASVIAGMEDNPPNTMGETFDLLAKKGILPDELALRLKKAVGFRNIAIHNYERIDWRIVHAIASKHLDDFSEFARIIESSALSS